MLLIEPQSVRSAKQSAGKFVSELPADDENVNEVERLKNNIGLIWFGRHNHYSRTSVLRVSV